MTHPADLADAHRRHWEDAELLFEHDRWANADQLYGFSAECGLKTVMQALGMPVDEAGKPSERQHRRHVQDIWKHFQGFAEGRQGERYLSLLPKDEPFAGWSHHNRYAHRRHCGKSEAERSRRGAQGICRMVQRAAGDGRI